MINNAYSNIFALNAMTQGKIWHVKPYSGRDSRDGKTADTALKTLTKAQSKAVADRNDIVLLYAESNTSSLTTDYQSAGLAWAKDAVHLIGVNAGGMLGSRSRIAQLSSVLTITDLFTLSADNCYIANISIFQGVASSTAVSPRAMVVSGERNRIVNCQISGMGDTSMDTAGARSLTVSGSENIFQHCYIGLNTIQRTTNVVEVGITGSGSALASRNVFEDCVFDTCTASTTGKIIAASYVGYFLILKNCMICASNSAAVTGAISTANMTGKVYMLGGAVFGSADVTTADDPAVLVASTYSTTVVDMGVAKATDVA